MISKWNKKLEINEIKIKNMIHPLSYQVHEERDNNKKKKVSWMTLFIDKEIASQALAMSILKKIILKIKITLIKN